ncbi:hypothetical protein A3A39_04130 [Candidatus Kaiserbacteria bacterium RIFCSPLOWO2_01_FULL_54_13]|uniref:Uncharacterized protein n=1 Tax=Candidatus Kaiserbacteria bacterium RIFCSPLOWO2_01_FULL_54_13 TaxID=1798512 RepID=A0A1F6F442_9BACT|nr:MAG: hypothetical protein A3A39_04130 [Candidatus Kaiserbacteria bacterium RIFCSPLOWO2_01_FULL_54_13]
MGINAIRFQKQSLIIGSRKTAFLTFGTHHILKPVIEPTGVLPPLYLLSTSGWHTIVPDMIVQFKKRGDYATKVAFSLSRYMQRIYILL